MGHIQQLAFALGPIEARTAVSQRPRASGRPAPSAAAAQPLLLPEGPSSPPPVTAVDPAAAPALPAPLPPAAPVPVATAAPAPLPATAGNLLSDGDRVAPARATLYMVVGFARQRERRRGGWHRLGEQGFAQRRPAEEHAARLLARGRADGVILVRQDLGPDAEAAEEPVILARHGELPAELLEV